MIKPQGFLELNHGLISNMSGAALIARDLTVDWLALPRFDSPPLMLRLLDADKGGYWSINFDADIKDNITRRYLSSAPIIESNLSINGREVKVIDFMPIGISAMSRYVIAPDDISYTMDIKPKFALGAVEPYVEGNTNDILFINPLGTETLELLINEGSCKVNGEGSISCSGKSMTLH